MTFLTRPVPLTLFASLLALPLTAAPQVGPVEEGRPYWSAAAGFSAVGFSASLSGDRLALGAPTTSSGLPGTALLFTPQAGLWHEEDALAANDGTPEDAFGTSLELDGTTLVVGAPNADAPGVASAGAAYVFVLQGGAWIQQAKLTAPDAVVSALFGHAVAVQGDTAVVGAPQVSAGQGALYVFTRGGSTWSFAQKLTVAGIGFGSRLGSSVAIDGERIAAGARLQPIGGNAVGAAHVFERAANVWSHTAELLAAVPQTTSLFGAALDLEGDRIVVGAPMEPASGLEDSGAAYVIDLVGGVWSQTQRLRGIAVPDSGQIGASVALSGARIAAGAPFGEAPGGGTGETRLFELAAGTWNETARIAGSAASAQDQIGRSIALEGTRLVVGAANGDVPSLGQKGEGYVFELAPASPWVYCTAKTASAGCVPSIGWSGTPSTSSAGPFDVTATQVVSQKFGILIYGKLYNDAPFLGGTLCIGSPILRTDLQSSGGSTSGADCTGSFSFDFNAHIDSGDDPALVAGAWVWSQYWYRDPLGSAGTGLSDALRFLIAP